MSDAPPSSAGRLGPRLAWGLVGAIVLVGLVPRLIHLGYSFVGDELSTLYVVRGRSLGEVVDVVRSDAEISPPLYFALAWAFGQLGDAPELIRVPALIAGVASIPLTYMVGARAIGRTAGVVAAAAMALNPFMVFYSTDARAYTVAIALLLATTLAMLIALERGRPGWWVAYAVGSVLAMLTHYTCAFVLAAQLLWLLWAHPEARRVALLANVGAAVAFLPWLGGMRADFDSPTIDVLSGLQGDGFDVKWEAVKAWAFGYPYNLPSRVPGDVAVIAGLAGILIGALGALTRWWRGRSGRFPSPSRGMVLVLVLALATPVAELVILGLGGSDLFGARNLNTASPGFALTIGALAAAAGPALGAICAALVLGVFAWGTARSLDPDVSTVRAQEAGDYIDAEAGSDDVVLDIFSAAFSPVPLTALDVVLPPDRETLRPYLPEGSPPFVRFPPPPRPIVEEAFRAAGDAHVFVVTTGDDIVSERDGRVELELPPAQPDRDVTETVSPPWRIVDSASFDGVHDVNVYELERIGAPAGR